MRSTALAFARLAFVALTLVAIVATLADLASRGVLNLVNFFSYFTIQSNVIAITGLTLSAVASLRSRDGEPARRYDLLRGGAVVYMTVTGVVYALLLENTDVNTPMQWVDVIVHKVMPIVIGVDWLIDPPPARISPRRSLIWLAYPVAWIAYTMVRGPIAAWYPYPFMDPAPQGYGPVIVIVGVILVAGTVLCLTVAAVGSWLGARRGPSAEPAPGT